MDKLFFKYQYYTTGLFFLQEGRPLAKISKMSYGNDIFSFIFIFKVWDFPDIAELHLTSAAAQAILRSSQPSFRYDLNARSL